MFTWIKIQFESWLNRRDETRRYNRERDQIKYETEIELQRRSLVCESCENLKMQNSYLQQTINKLLEAQLTKPEEVHATNMNIPITPRIPVGWREQRHKLEQESRKQADELLKKKNEELQNEITEGKVNAI